MLHIVHVNDTEAVGVRQAWPRLATAIRRLRRAGACDVLVHAGDVRLGAGPSRATVTLLNALRFDAIALGNHELEFGLKALREQVRRLRPPILCANGIGPLSGFRPYRVLRRGGVRVAVCGLTRGDTDGWLAGPEAVGDPAAALRAMVPTLRRRADVVVLVSHCGLLEDLRLAEAVDGIDVIVSGHTHELLEEPLRVGRTVVVQAGSHGRHIGWVTIEPHRRTEDGALTVTAGVMPVGELPEDAYTLALAAAAEAEDEEVVGSIDIDLVNRPAGEPGETPLDNLYVDLMRAHTGADVGLLPCGLFTSPLPAGPIRRHQLAHITSRERVARVRLTGQELRRVLDSGAREAYRLLLTSGARVEYEARRPTGERIRSIVVGDPPVALEPEREYVVACTEYMAKDFEKLGRSVECLSTTAEDLLLEQLAKRGTLSPRVDGRLVVHGRLPGRPPFRAPA